MAGTGLEGGTDEGGLLTSILEDAPRCTEPSPRPLFKGLKVKIAPICVMTGAFFKGFSRKGRRKNNNNKKADLMINSHALPLTLKGTIVSAQRCKSS